MSTEHQRVAHRFGEVVSDLVFAPNGKLAELIRVHLADGRVVSFGARDLATAAAIADGVVRPLLTRIAQRDLAAGLRDPRPITLEELVSATETYFVERSRSITRENVRSVLAGRIPDDQTVTRVDRVSAEGEQP